MSDSAVPENPQPEAVFADDETGTIAGIQSEIGVPDPTELAPVYAEFGAAVHDTQVLEFGLVLLMALATRYDDARFERKAVASLSSAQAGKTIGVPVGMCGEMAGETRIIPLLLGLGLREFSMQPAALLRAREQIRGLPLDQLERAATQVLENLDLADPLDLVEP
mgnify:CR=1 FL=1